MPESEQAAQAAARASRDRQRDKQRGTWEDPAIVGDPRIANHDPLVRRVAEKLHANESMHMHEYIRRVICPYCALRASRVVRWSVQANNGRPLRHDTPFGLINHTTFQIQVADGSTWVDVGPEWDSLTDAAAELANIKSRYRVVLITREAIEVAAGPPPVG